MKKINIWHLVWQIGIYAILFIILYLVIQYKVFWEGRDSGTYLYFYDCGNGNICTTTENTGDYYSSIKCENDKCPYIKALNKEIAIMSSNNNEYIYDCLTGNIINNNYMEYTFLNNNFIVKDSNNKYGIINRLGEEVIALSDKIITDYKDGFIVYMENGVKGIINEEKQIDIKPSYEDIILINDKIYAYLEENKYFIASYDTELPVNGNIYDYLYPVDNNTILVIKDNKLDIIDSSLKSNLIMKIDTNYSYEVEQERVSLNIINENNLLFFSIVLNDNEITNYMYDIKGKKLYN